ncbi:MAG TPA: HNH endonuclease signature motif containing protein [Bacteroidia bacterium]|nr:HNH endonuclease signature motif containing protein [Bacteroidia bacterium]
MKDIGNYIVYPDGTVISKKLKRPLKPWSMKGYSQIKCDGKAITIHRLIAQIFIPNPENKSEVNHKNGIKSDNRIENLEWCTHSENIQHAYDNGMIKRKKNVINTEIAEHSKRVV